MGTRRRNCRTWTITQQPRSTYIIDMKAIQVMFDEDLLAQLDADEDVKKKGRSAVLREAATAYLGSLGSRKMREVNEALAIATGCDQ